MMTLRKYFLWSSDWFCDFNYYNILFEDVKITNYLQSIFSSLKYPTSNFIIKRNDYKIIIQSTFYIFFFFKRKLRRNQLLYYFRKHKRYLINHFLLRKSTYFLFKKISNKIYFFLFKYRKYKMNFFNFFHVNIPITDIKTVYYYNFLGRFNSYINTFFLFKLNYIRNVLVFILNQGITCNNTNYISHSTIHDIKVSFYNSVSEYIHTFYNKYYWSSKLNYSIGNNLILLNKIKSKFNFIRYKNNFLYDFFYNKSNNFIDNMNFNKLFINFNNYKIKLQSISTIIHNENGINNINNTKKNSFNNVLDIYDYSLVYLFNNYLNNKYLIHLFKREKSFLVYTFLTTNNYIINYENNFLNHSNYFLWYFYTRKYYLHFYNKLHYYVLDKKVFYKYFRIYYYYNLLGYRINKLFSFIGTYKINTIFKLKIKTIDLILGTDLNFHIINNLNVCRSSAYIITKYSNYFKSLLGFVNYTKKLYYNHISLKKGLTEKRITNINQVNNGLFRIKKKLPLYKKKLSLIKYIKKGFDYLIDKYNFYIKKKKVIEKKLIRFLIKIKLISNKYNKHHYVIFSGKNMTIGKKKFAINSYHIINQFKTQIIKLNAHIHLLKNINKGIYHIDCNKYINNNKIKFISTHWNHQYANINRNNLFLWSDFYHHYFNYTDKIHQMKSLFHIRMSSNSSVLTSHLYNKHRNKRNILKKNTFHNTRKSYSTSLHRRKRRFLLKRLHKRNKNLNLSLLNSHYLSLKNNSKFSKPRYSNYKNNISSNNNHNIYNYYVNHFHNLHNNYNINYNYYITKNYISLRNLIDKFSNNINLNKKLNYNNKIKNNTSQIINIFNKTNNLVYLYSHHLIYNIIFRIHFKWVYSKIFFNKSVLLYRWSLIKCINDVIGNYFINKSKNKLLLDFLKKTIYYLYNKMMPVVKLKKWSFFSSNMKVNIFSKILWFYYIINNLNIILSVNKSKIIGNIINWSDVISNNAITNDYSYLSSIFYIFRKSFFFNYINNVLDVYTNKKINNNLIFVKKSINNNFTRIKYKFYYITNNNIINNSYYPFSSINNIIYDKNNNIYSRGWYTDFMNINFIINNKIYKLYNCINKSFTPCHWIWYTSFLDLIIMVFKIIKHYCYIYIKNFFLLLSPVDLFDDLYSSIYTNLTYATHVFKLIYTFYNNYYIYFSKVLNIDYFNTSILRSLLKNKSYYSYYTKYYLLNFLYLIYYIELSISEYSNNNCFLFLNYSLRLKYYLNSAKMWCEYIAFYLRKKFSIWKLFSLIKKQQRIEKNKILYDYSSDKKDNIFLHSYKYPLRGIRITYSGNFKKAKRKRKLYYYVWLSDIRYTGKMPLKKFKYYIDYYSISVPLKRSSIGIKFWLLFDIH